MRPLVYIDTSVVGGCFDIEFKAASEALFAEFIAGLKIAMTSDLLLEELEPAPEQIRTQIDKIPDRFRQNAFLSEEILILADAYVREAALPKGSLMDARHIACATVYRADVLASWNFKHIVNLNRIRFINATNLRLGYPILEIRSPQEILENV